MGTGCLTVGGGAEALTPALGAAADAGDAPLACPGPASRCAAQVPRPPTRAVHARGGDPAPPGGNHFSCIPSRSIAFIEKSVYIHTRLWFAEWESITYIAVHSASFIKKLSPAAFPFGAHVSVLFSYVAFDGMTLAVPLGLRGWPVGPSPASRRPGLRVR